MPIFLIWFILEIYIFANFADNYGFFQTLFYYFVPSLLGVLLLSQFKASGFQKMQNNWQNGKEPTSDILHTTAKIIGAILLIPPTFIPRILALLLVTPGIRHILVFISQAFFIKKLVTAGSTLFQTGRGGFTFYSSVKGFPGFNPQADSNFEKESALARDVEAIDVTPIEITHRDKKDS